MKSELTFRVSDELRLLVLRLFSSELIIGTVPEVGEIVLYEFSNL